MGALASPPLLVIALGLCLMYGAGSFHLARRRRAEDIEALQRALGDGATQIETLVVCQAIQLRGPLAELSPGRVWLCFVDELLVLVSTSGDNTMAGVELTKLARISLVERAHAHTYVIAIQVAGSSSISMLEIARMDDFVRVVNVLVSKGIRIHHRSGHAAEPCARRLSEGLALAAGGLLLLMLVPWVWLPSAIDDNIVWSWEFIGEVRPPWPAMCAAVGIGAGLTLSLFDRPTSRIEFGALACTLGLVPLLLTLRSIGAGWHELVRIVSPALLIGMVSLRCGYPHHGILRRLLPVTVALVMLSWITLDGRIDVWLVTRGAARGTELQVVTFALIASTLIGCLPRVPDWLLRVQLMILACWPLICSLAQIDSGDAPLVGFIQHDLARLVWIPLAVSAWTTLYGLGLASLAGRVFEPPERIPRAWIPLAAVAATSVLVAVVAIATASSGAVHGP